MCLRLSNTLSRAVIIYLQVFLMTLSSNVMFSHIQAIPSVIYEFYKRPVEMNGRSSHAHLGPGNIVHFIPAVWYYRVILG